MLSFIFIDCIKKTVIDYVIRRRFRRIFYFYAKLSSAYFPFVCGVPCRWKWYKFVLCWYCCDREYPQVLQYLFRYRKMCVQTGGVNYAETPFADWHLHLCTRLSSLAKYSCGLWVCRFSLQKSYRFLFLALLHSGIKTSLHTKMSQEVLPLGSFFLFHKHKKPNLKDKKSRHNFY